MQASLTVDVRLRFLGHVRRGLIHHDNHMWKNNFGISCDIWDHVFRTYKRGEWDRSKITRPRSIWGLFKIKWI